MPAPRRTGLAALLTALLAAAPAAAAAPLSGGGTVARVDFERHVMGVFGRMGCNSGSCHGSFQGKGGFRLSLFGYDPAKDFLALTREGGGRRINRVDPDRSLLLLKATGRVDHGGGVRFARDSWAYQLLREWVASGAPWHKGSGTVAAVRVSPPEYAFDRPGQSGRLAVTARFADGAEEDITPLCDFRSNDDAVAEVTPQGGLRALRAGDTAVVVSYRGNVAPVRVLVPGELPPGTAYPAVPEANAVDHAVFAKLRRLNIVPSDLSTDAEFLRRVTIDTVGTLPTPQEVRDFLADTRPDKRTRKVDELLVHPMHAALWATKFCDLTGNNTDQLENPPQLRAKLSQMWHDWFRKRLAANVPYDEIVRGVLCATTREGHTPEEYLTQFKGLEEAARKGFATPYAERDTLDLFWRRQANVPVEQWGEKTAAAFLGVRLECAQCHKHPFDRWTQADYRAYANVFGAVAVGVSPDAQKAYKAEIDERRKPRQGGKNFLPPMTLREVFIAPRGKGAGPLPDPDTNKPLPPKALGGPAIQVSPGGDPRVPLWEWMRSPDNPFFARAFANRVWGHYLGVGVVQPVDDFSLANPPSNPELLDLLAREFASGGYDIRRLERLVLTSRAYQLSSAVNATNRLDRTNFSHAYVRPLMAEVVVDVLNEAVGLKENFGPDAPPGCRAIEVGASRVQGQGGYAFRVFGRPPRTTACDCERSAGPGLPQKLYLMADPSVVQKVQSPQNRLKTLLAEHPDDAAALDELFLATLSRHPTDKDRALFAGHRARARTRHAAFADTLWALVNTAEFIFNH
jgi:hypothetical protein